MSEISVRVLGEEDWSVYRELRLAALQESPQAFVDSYADEVGYDEARWRSRMTKASQLLAEENGRAVGIASTAATDEDVTVADVYGLWVVPEVRHAGVAWALMEAAVRLAAQQGRRKLCYWVGQENMRAIGFASNFGFLPSDLRRPARVPSEGFGAEEVAMLHPVQPDPAQVPNGNRSGLGRQDGTTS